ncbi:MAG: MBL fold metallo-hydrolase [Planctomycetota bacterium]
MVELPPVKRFESDSGVRIYRIPFQAFPHLDARVYLLLGAGEPTLIDGGSGALNSTSEILDGIRRVGEDFGEGVRPRDVRRMIITHAHIDHFGGASQVLAEMPEAIVYIHPLDAGPVAAWEEHAVLAKRRLAAFLSEAGVAPNEAAPLLDASRYDRKRIAAVPVTALLTDGEVIDGMRVIHTPGHSPGHVCLAIGNILLSADHVLAKTIPQQWPESMLPFTGLAHYLESLDKIDQAGAFELALAAHEPVIHNLSARVATIRASHLRRLDRLLDILRHAGRPLTIHEMTTRMYTEAVGFRGFLAVTDVGARVEYLHQRGRMRVENLDEIEHNPSAVPVYVPTD